MSTSTTPTTTTTPSPLSSFPWTPPSIPSLALALASTNPWAHPYTSSLASSFMTSPLLHRYTCSSPSSSSSSSSTTLTSGGQASNLSVPLWNPLVQVQPTGMMDSNCTYNNNFGKALGNGCFDYPFFIHSSTDLLANPAPLSTTTPLSSSSLRSKSRMETFYLVDAPATTTSTTTTIAVTPVNKIEDQFQPLSLSEDRSPGWKLHQIKKTPTQHFADTIWAKFPSLSLFNNTNAIGNDNRFPWWSSIPVGATSFSSPLSLNNLIPCEMDEVDISTKCEVGSEHILSPYLDIEPSTTTSATNTMNATAAEFNLRSDSLYKDNLLGHTFFVAHPSHQSHWTLQQGLVQDQVQEQKQEEQEGHEQEGTQVLPTASMELGDPLWVSSPPLWSSTSCSTSSGVKSNTKGTTSTLIQKASLKSAPISSSSRRPCRNPYTSTNVIGIGLGLGLGMLYPPFASLNFTTTAAGRAMDMIRQRVATAEVKAQYTYLSLHSRLLKMLRQDEGEDGDEGGEYYQEAQQTQGAKEDGTKVEMEVGSVSSGSGGCSDEDGSLSADADMETETESDDSFSGSGSDKGPPDSCQKVDYHHHHKMSVLECLCYS
ncbi:MAG: hypothetical protein J3R72DRAFT_473763 [Linnemannia gamsii]|nr:MAG: hypothetical protein J3R72DRAFT_473763 [Linnemannia gamsii]